ncbi:MAG: hypothetical protein U5K43_12070 [Halofilum sp. (in: g-proteobacteria)]|nr:hypothetical protein [Halofilum sp. (in: g-proteobacteria)]
MLAFEVLRGWRLFELSHLGTHFAGLAIALALLGLGVAGTVLALLGPRRAVTGDWLASSGRGVRRGGCLLLCSRWARRASPCARSSPAGTRASSRGCCSST